MKKFEFYDESYEDHDGWWDEVYGDGENHHYSLVSVLDSCVSLEDKVELSMLPEHNHWPDVGEHLLSEIDSLDIKSLEKHLLGMGYVITIDGVCIFSYDTQQQGYLKSVSGAYTALPKLVNKYKSDKSFISKLGELLSDCGIEGEAMDSFINLVYIRDKVVDVLPFLNNK